MASFEPPVPFDLPLNGARVDSSHVTQAHVDTLRLFDECESGLRRYLRACGLTPDAADDIIQETFLGLFKHLCLGRPRDNLQGWVYRVSYRLASKHRYRVSRRSWAEDPFEAHADTMVDPGQDPERALFDRERQRRLRSVVHALPPRARDCLLLRAEGLRYREIARILQLSLGGVAKALALAVTRLSNAVKDERP
jgi:RNA polymerase sigma-70 factor (ECF subfamily)